MYSLNGVYSKKLLLTSSCENKYVPFLTCKFRQKGQMPDVKMPRAISKF